MSKIVKTLEDGNNIVNNILNNKSGKLVYGSSCSQIVYNITNSLENNILNKKDEIVLIYLLMNHV